MNNLTNICKVCKVEQQRLGYFSGRSAVCCKCIHATIKAYLNTYYGNNGDKVKTNEKASCRSVRVARPAPPLPQRHLRRCCLCIIFSNRFCSSIVLATPV